MASTGPVGVWKDAVASTGPVGVWKDAVASVCSGSCPSWEPDDDGATRTVLAVSGWAKARAALGQVAVEPLPVLPEGPEVAGPDPVAKGPAGCPAALGGVPGRPASVPVPGPAGPGWGVCLGPAFGRAPEPVRCRYIAHSARSSVPTQNTVTTNPPSEDPIQPWTNQEGTIPYLPRPKPVMTATMAPASPVLISPMSACSTWMRPSRSSGSSAQARP